MDVDAETAAMSRNLPESIVCPDCGRTQKAYAVTIGEDAFHPLRCLECDHARPKKFERCVKRWWWNRKGYRYR